MHSKGQLVNKNLSFVTSVIGVSGKLKIPKNIKFCMITRAVGQIHLLSIESRTLRNLVFPQKKYFGRNPKSGQNFII